MGATVNNHTGTLDVNVRCLQHTGSEAIPGSAHKCLEPGITIVTDIHWCLLCVGKVLNVFLHLIPTGDKFSYSAGG